MRVILYRSRYLIGSDKCARRTIKMTKARLYTNKNSKREKSRYEEKSCEVIWIIFEKNFFFLSFFALIKLFNSYEFLIHIVWIDNLINKMSIKYKFRIIVTEKLLWNYKIFLLFKLKERINKRNLNFLILWVNKVNSWASVKRKIIEDTIFLLAKLEEHVFQIITREKIFKSIITKCIFIIDKLN